MTPASGKADGGAELLREALVALRAQRTMDDRGPQPRKFDEALSWRENDIKARALVDDAIIHITAHLATAAANGPGEADAARYRFLRDSQNRATDSDWPAIYQDDRCALTGKEADEIIDHFIAKDAAHGN